MHVRRTTKATVLQMLLSTAMRSLPGLLMVVAAMSLIDQSLTNMQGGWISISTLPTTHMQQKEFTYVKGECKPNH